MSRIITILGAALIALSALPALAQGEGLSALARALPEASRIEDAQGGIRLTLGLSQPVPYRLRFLANPPRLVADFNEVDFTSLRAAAPETGRRVTAVQMGPVRPGWSRLVLEMSGPFGLTSADMRRDVETGQAQLVLQLAPQRPEAFAAAAADPQEALWGLPQPADLPPPRARQDGTRPLRVVLDPGHGGIDPGAERAGLKEADLMLRFARELQEVLRRAGMEVVLTRDANYFVPLETRISIARAAQADLFLSLHADALSEGQATGASVYTLSDTASDRASQLLAERHDRADLLAGVDLSAHDDVIAAVLMEMARRETEPRADHLAAALVAGFRKGEIRLHKRPRHEAGFSVLKSPDIPSVLIELGFLSSPRDRANLVDPAWRGRATAAIRDALRDWAVEDAAQAALLRQ